jgi:hypothetical protein
MDKTSIFFLSTQTEIEKGGSDRAAGGPPGHSGSREWGGRREEVEGNSFRSSPRAGTACGERSTAAGGLQAEAALMAAVGARGREGSDLGGAWRGGERRRAIYRRGKAVSRPRRAREARAPAMAVRPASAVK